jgi:hypothetical protein
MLFALVFLLFPYHFISMDVFTDFLQTTQRARPRISPDRNHLPALLAVQARRHDDQEEARIPHRARVSRAYRRCSCPELQISGLIGLEGRACAFTNIRRLERKSSLNDLLEMAFIWWGCIGLVLRTGCSSGLALFCKRGIFIVLLERLSGN